MLPAQVAGAACVLAWPFGAAAGALGIGGLALLGLGMPIMGLIQAGSESKRINEGDAEAIAQYLTDDDVIEFKRLKASEEGNTEKKIAGLLPPAAKTTAVKSPKPQSQSQAIEFHAIKTQPENGPTNPPSRTPTWPDGEHLFMVGLSGGAKTTVLQWITSQTTDPVVYLTIKTDDKAPGSWLAYRLDKFAGERLLHQLLWLLDTLETWVRKGIKHRLVIDEYVSLQDAAKSACKQIKSGSELKGLADRLENLVKLYIRTGRSDGHYLGLLSQTPNGTDNFGSAKTQQGLRVFLCASEKSSEKFRFMVPWAKQMFADLVTPEVGEALKTIKTGYWHLFADGGELVLNPTPKPELEQVTCRECPTHLSGEKPTVRDSIEARILDYLAKNGPATARTVRNSCTRASDDPRLCTDEIRAILARLGTAGEIQSYPDRGTTYYSRN